FLLVILTAIVSTAKADPPTDEGKNIFTARCAACHNINKIIVGPALSGVDQRRSIDWIISFIHSSQSVVRSGDAYAAALFEKFNKVTMRDHPDLTKDNIKNIVEYIKSASKISNGEKAPFAKPSVNKPYYIPLSIQSNYLFFIGYLIVVVTLIMPLFLTVYSTGFREKLRGN